MLEVGMNIVLPLVQMLKIYCIHILKLSRMLNGMSYKLFSVDLNVGFDILLGFPISYEYKVIVVSWIFCQDAPLLLTSHQWLISVKPPVGSMRKMFAVEVDTATSCIWRRLVGVFHFCSLLESHATNRSHWFIHSVYFRELRRKLFGRNRRRRSRSRSRSHSPHRNRGYEERSHGGRGFGRRDEERDHRPHDRRRPRSRSPGRRGSPGGRRNRSPPARESSVERRAKIEQWNKEREQAGPDNKHDNVSSENDRNGYSQNASHYDDHQ